MAAFSSQHGTRGRGVTGGLGKRVKRWVGGLLGLSLGVAPVAAHAYAEDVHYQLALRALGQTVLAEPAATPSLAVTAAIRTAIDAHARQSPTFQAEWIKRYPSPGDFDDWAFKHFLLFSPSSRVFGIDRLDERTVGGSRLLDMVAQATRHPDEDWRNRDRLAYSPQRVELKDLSGGRVPVDPAILNMGKLGYLSSQAHAHYGLAPLEFSPDADVLKTEPRRFARKAGYERAPIITLAAEMAQIHLDVAMLAAHSDAPGAKEMAWLYAGAGMHYLEDIGNQIHTVQVGCYDFFQDAFFERLKLGILTGGGYVRPMRSLASLGIDILTNHHVLSEHLTEKRMQGALSGGADEDSKRLLTAPTQEDAEFSAQLDKALASLGPNPERGEFALLITRALIEISSHEGDDVYLATRSIADPILRTRFGHYDETRDDPDRALIPRSQQNEQSYRDFFSLQERAFRRVGTALRRWVALQNRGMGTASQPISAEERAVVRAVALERLIQRQLHFLQQQELRLADYLRQPPQVQTQPEKSMPILLFDVAVLAAIIALFYVGTKRWQKRSA